MYLCAWVCVHVYNVLCVYVCVCVCVCVCTGSEAEQRIDQFRRKSPGKKDVQETYVYSKRGLLIVLLIGLNTAKNELRHIQARAQGDVTSP